MSSKRQKASGLVLPENLTPTDFICFTMMIPNEREYIAAFIGQIVALGRWYTWEKSTIEGDTRATQAAAFWRSIIQTNMCIAYGEVNVPCGCCPDQQIMIATQRIALADLENRARLAAFVPENPQTVDSNAPAEGQTFSYDGTEAGMAALCQAEKAFVVEMLANTLIAYEIGTVVIGLITAALTALLGPLGGIIGGVGTTIAGLAIEGVEAAIADTTAIGNVACQLKDAMAGLAATQANWSNAIDSLSPGSGHEYTIITILKNTCGNSSLLGGLQRQYNYMLFLACLGQSSRNVQGGLNDCPCQGDCDDWEAIIQHGTILSTGANYAEIEAEWIPDEAHYEIWLNWFPVDTTLCCYVDHEVLISGDWINNNQDFYTCTGEHVANRDPSGSAIRSLLVYWLTPFTLRIYRSA